MPPTPQDEAVPWPPGVNVPLPSKDGPVFRWHIKYRTTDKQECAGVVSDLNLEDMRTFARSLRKQGLEAYEIKKLRGGAAQAPAAPDPALEEWKHKKIKQGERMVRRKIATGWATPAQGDAQIRNMRAKIEGVSSAEEVSERARKRQDQARDGLAALSRRITQVPKEKFCEAIHSIDETRKELGRPELLSKEAATHCVVSGNEHYPSALIIARGVVKCFFDDVAWDVQAQHVARALPDHFRVLKDAGFDVVACRCSSGEK